MLLRLVISRNNITSSIGLDYTIKLDPTTLHSIFGYTNELHDILIADVFLAALMLLLPATATGGVVRDAVFNPCKTYTLNDLLNLDCSDQGLSELPDGLNYNVSRK